MTRNARRRIAVGLVAVLAFPTARLVAQSAKDRPNFSGRWQLAKPLDSLANVAFELTVSQDAVAVTVERRSLSGSGSETYRPDLTQGTVTGDGWRTLLTTRWEGRTLVIESGRYAVQGPDSGRFTERGETWSLDSKGLLTITVTERRSGANPTSTTLTYRRR